MKLSKPIQAHGETLTELTFREPNGGDLLQCGFPFKTEMAASNPIRHVDMEVIGRYISSLAGIPPISVKQLSLIDGTRAMGVVLDFFTNSETRNGSSNSTSTSPLPGETQNTSLN